MEHHPKLHYLKIHKKQKNIETTISYQSKSTVNTSSLNRNRPRDTIPKKTVHNKHKENQFQSLDSGQDMAKTLKGKLNLQQKSKNSWIVKTIKNSSGPQPMSLLHQCYSSNGHKRNICTTKISSTASIEN